MAGPTKYILVGTTNWYCGSDEIELCGYVTRASKIDNKTQNKV